MLLLLKIYAVSDSIGETAELVAKGIASQFDENIEVVRTPYIKNIEKAINFIESIDNPKEALLVSTVITIEVREFLVEKCAEKGISISNVLSPGINLLSKKLNKLPSFKAGSVWDIDNDYYKRIQAIEFAIQYDDSKDFSGIDIADVILVGLSRTSKTPLSMYLAYKGIKALNIPLIPEAPPPSKLFDVPKDKVIALTIDPFKLIDIRKHRLEKIASSYSSLTYADESRILEELEFSDKIINRLRCKKIDVTNRAIEDTALIIMKELKLL